MNGNNQYYGNQPNSGNAPGGQPGGVPQGNPYVNVRHINTQQPGSNKGAGIALTIITIAESLLLIGLLVLGTVLLIKLNSTPEETVSVDVMQTAEPADSSAADADADAAAVPAATETPAPDYDFSALVIDGYTEDLDSTGGTISFVIPEINWDGGDVQAVNDDMYDFYIPFIEDMRNTDYSNRAYGESGGISYEWYMNSGILTIIVDNYLYPDASGWHEQDVWNVDFRNPENPVSMSEDDVLDYFGISKDELAEQAAVALGNAFCTSYSNAFDNGMDPYDSFTLGQFNKTIEESNAAAAIPFVGEDGHLWIKGTVYSIAGGDHYPYMIDMEEYETSSYYTDYMGG